MFLQLRDVVPQLWKLPEKNPLTGQYAVEGD